MSQWNENHDYDYSHLFACTYETHIKTHHYYNVLQAILLHNKSLIKVLFSKTFILPSFYSAFYIVPIQCDDGNGNIYGCHAPKYRAYNLYAYNTRRLHSSDEL